VSAEAEARVWAQRARQFRLPRATAQALVQAVRNGADADWFASEGRTHVFVHLPEGELAGAVLAVVLERTGFAYDTESASWRVVVGARGVIE
jgi:hypothetical protein